MNRLWKVISLALADYRHESLLSLCSIFALAAALTPLLVLFGLKAGIVGGLTSRLLTDPRNLEITPAGVGNYSIAWLDETRKRADVAFLEPQTRSISARLDLYPTGGTKSVSVDLLATAARDPLLDKWAVTPAQQEEIILTATAARQLNITAPGQSITGKLSRQRSGRLEQASLTLKVVGILPLEAEQREIAYVTLGLMESTEDYRDARAVPRYDWPGDEPAVVRATYPSFRLYAANLDSVDTLRKFLEDQDIKVYTRAEEISAVRDLDRAFTILGALLFVVVGGGFFASVMSSALAQINRKQRSLAVLRLLGFSAHHLALFPLAQSLGTALLGSGVALGLFWLIQFAINILFREQVVAGESICTLSALQCVEAVLLTCLFMLCGSLSAMRRILSIEPAEVIRDV